MLCAALQHESVQDRSIRRLDEQTRGFDMDLDIWLRSLVRSAVQLTIIVGFVLHVAIPYVLYRMRVVIIEPWPTALTLYAEGRPEAKNSKQYVCDKRHNSGPCASGAWIEFYPDEQGLPVVRYLFEELAVCEGFASALHASVREAQKRPAMKPPTPGPKTKEQLQEDLKVSGERQRLVELQSVANVVSKCSAKRSVDITFNSRGQ